MIAVMQLVTRSRFRIYLDRQSLGKPRDLGGDLEAMIRAYLQSGRVSNLYKNPSLPLISPRRGRNQAFRDGSRWT